MQKRLNQFMLLLMVLAVVMANAAGATTAYADDGGTGDTPTDGTATATPTVDEDQPVTEEVVSVPEILDQLPADTELVVVNEAGEAEPLATEEAAAIISTGDPMWCPDTATPGDAGCTGSFTSFASLIAALEADALLTVPQYTGDGTVWVEGSYDPNNDSAQIEFNGSTLTTLHNLTIQGGWSGGNDQNTAGTSSVHVSVVFANWTGNITLNDIDIANGGGDNAGFGLFVDTTGAVALDNVSVDSTPLNTLHKGDGAVVNSTGNVNITDSDFNNNAGNGLQVKSGGTISLNTVLASDNILTGAFLDSCLYNTGSGLCAGNGAVTVTSAASTNLFNDNGFNGLVVDAGGGIAIDHTHVNNIPNHGVNGAVLTSADADGTENVTIAQSEFNGNSNGRGLDVLTDGSIGLTSINAFSNGTGAVLDTTNGVGTITISGSDFQTNNLTGLHAESGSTINLTNVVGSDNGTNGAYLTAEGNIIVANSTFDDNVHFDYPEDPGLYASSNGGDITLTSVNANGNVYGAGTVLNTKDSGAITVTGGQYNTNGTFGIEAMGQDGDITLNNVIASFNMVKGAYLATYGTGNIFIANSTFDENGSYGIYANTSEGNINLDNDAVDGNNLTDYGAVLAAEYGGDVTVSNSTFQRNTEVGLRIIGSSDVSLVNVIADNNGENGVEVYSTYTAGPVCPGAEVVNVAVSVDGGALTNNGGYGLMVKPGPEGTLIFLNSSPFNGSNGLGDFLLDLSAPSASDDCGHEDQPSDSKDSNIVYVPSTGGDPVEQDCEQFASTILKLPNGSWINVGCPFTGFSNLAELLEENLPGQLGAGTNFAAGVTVSLTDENGNTTLNEDGTITINFQVPEDTRGRGYSILFWDTTLNGGEGGWVEMPQYEAGTSFPLHPEDPDDARTIVSGVQKIGNVVTLTVDFPGQFILVAR